MSKPEGIPQDIRSSAAVVASDLRVLLFEIAPVAAKLWGSDGIIAAMNDAIARTIMVAKEEEREACAQIADPIDTDERMSDIEKQEFDLRDVISQDIRKRGNVS